MKHLKSNMISKLLGNVPVVAWLDHADGVVRVMKHAELGRPTIYDMNSPNMSSQPDAQKSPFGTSVSHNPVLRAFGKKVKVPRPPNAFILYRQHWHPHYKQHNKDMHNNDISKELGRRWKNEPDSVKDNYKKLAEELKAKHAALYPDYQYAPRKPGEKKRRMTARKLEKLRETQHVQEASAFSSPESQDSSGVGSLGHDIPIGYDIDLMMTPSSTNDLNLDHIPTTPPQPVQYQGNDIFACILPSSFDNIQAEVDRECGKYGDDYVDVAESNNSLIDMRPEENTFQATPTASQVDRQNEWESLIDWQGLNHAIAESEDMTEDYDQDLIVEQRSGPDQSNKSYEEPTIFWK